MKSFLLLIGFLCLNVAWGIQGWETDMAQAKQKAAEQNKDLFIAYKGSTWQPDETGRPEKIFTTDLFKQMTGELFILVEQEYPPPPKEKASTQNTYETNVLFADKQGRPYNAFSEGALVNGSAWLQGEIDFSQKRKKDCLAQIDAIQKMEGEEKYKAIGQFFTNSVSEYFTHLYPLYKTWEEECLAHDKNDISGIKRHKELIDSLWLNGNSNLFQFIIQICCIPEDENQKQLRQIAPQIPEKYRTPLLKLAKLLNQLYTAKTETAKKDIWDKISLLNKKEFSSLLVNQNLVQDITLVFTVSELTKKSEACSSAEQFEKMANQKYSFVEKLSPETKSASMTIKFVKQFMPTLFFLQNSLLPYKTNDPQLLIKNPEELLQKIENFKNTRQLSRENLQLIMLAEAITLCKKGDMEKGLNLLQETRDIAPWTQNAKNANISFNKITENKKLISLLHKQFKEGNTERIEELKQLISTDLSINYTLFFIN